MRKKLVVLFFTLVIALQFMPVFAAEPLEMFYDDFEGYGNQEKLTYGKEGGWTTDDFSQQGVNTQQVASYGNLVKEEGNTLLKLGAVPHILGTSGAIKKYWAFGQKGIVEFTFKTDELKGKKTVSLASGATAAPLFSIEDEVIFAGADETLPLAKIETGRFYQVVLQFDAVTKRLDVYLDGKKITQRNTYMSSAISPQNGVNVTFGVGGGTDFPVSFYLDDVRVYNGAGAMKPQALAAVNPTARFTSEESNALLDEYFKDDLYAGEIGQKNKDALTFILMTDKVYEGAAIKQAAAALAQHNQVYLPAAYVCGYFGAELAVLEDGTGGIAYQGKQLTVQKDGTVNCAGVPYEDGIVWQDGQAFVSGPAMAALLGKEFIFDGICFASLAPAGVYDLSRDKELMKEMTNRAVFSRPSQDQILADYQNNAPKNRPYINATDARFAEIKVAVERGGNVKTMFEKIQADAEAILSQPVVSYQPEGSGGYWILDTTHEFTRRIYTLGLTYKVTGRAVYRDKMREELLAAAGFPTWQEYDTLANGVILQGVCVGYDWLYNELSETDRKTVWNAILQKGILPTVGAYRNPDSTPTMAYHWVKGTNNWNMVCNAGIIMGALTIMDKEPQLGSEVLASAFKSLEYYMYEYLPDGGNMEGPAYWDFAMKLFVPAMDMCAATLGTDYGYPTAAGVRDTVYFPLLTDGVTSFNFHDATPDLPNSAVNSYYSKRLQSPDLTAVRTNQILAGTYKPLAQDLLWMDLDAAETPEENDLPLDKHFRYAETGAMRSSWSDPYALLLDYHGGENDVNHGQLDKGTFVLDALGERWACDLGTDDLTYSGEDHQRYQLYRYRPEGHNTLVINPSASNGQNLPAWNPVTNYKYGIGESYTVADLTNSYTPDAASVVRGYRLEENRSRAVVQDEIHLNQAGEVWWFMHTQADIEILPDNMSAILKIGNKRLYVQVVSNQKVQFGMMEAVGLPQSIVDSRQASNSAYQKLYIKATGAKDVTFRVTMTPLRLFDELPDTKNTAIIPVADWTVQDTPSAEPCAQQITLDGQVLPAFEPQRLNYQVSVPFENTQPKAEVTVGEGFQSSVSYSGNMIKADVWEQADPKKRVYYLIELQPSPIMGMPQGFIERKILSGEASDTEDEEFPVNNTFDGDLTTRWAAVGKVYLDYDLGAVYQLDALGLAYFKGNERVYKFKVETSNDQSNWKEVYRGKTSGKTEGLETYRLESSSARYVRITGYGAETVTWNSVNEVKLYSEAK